MEKQKGYSIEEIQRNIHIIDHTYKAGFKKEYLLISDVHYDSKKCVRKLLKKHLDQAVEKNAGIICVGDWFDLMGALDDFRTTYSDIEKSVAEINYVDKVVEHSYEFLKDYVDNLVMFSHGNHETQWLKKHYTNPLVSLTRSLNQKRKKGGIILSGYAGWLVFRFRDKTGSGTRQKRMFYHHGQRGNAQRSKGVLQIDLDTMKFPDADIIVKGDDHQRWYHPSSGRWRLDQNYNMYQSFQKHIRLGSYKDGLGDMYGGWEVEKSFQPLGLGGWWIKFSYHGITQATNGRDLIQTSIYETQ